MTRDVACPTCRRKLRVPGTVKMQQFQCPLCRTTFPDPDSEPTAPDAPLAIDLVSPTLPFVVSTEPRDCDLGGSVTDTVEPPLIPRYKLSSPGQISFAYWLGGPLAGHILLTLNRVALGMKTGSYSHPVFVAGVVAMPILALGALPLPVSARYCLVLLLHLGSAAYLSWDNRSINQLTYQIHCSRGGKRQRNAVVCVSILMGLGLTIAAVVVGPQFRPARPSGP
jgi:hypothetical protein